MMVGAGLFQIKGMELSRVMLGECTVGYISGFAEAYPSTALRMTKRF